jgi:hypothetical protein
MGLKYEHIIKRMSLEEKALMMSGKIPGSRWTIHSMEFHL